MPEQELDAVLDNTDAPVQAGSFENALKRTLFNAQILQLDVESFGRFQGDYGQYWKLKGKLVKEAKDIDGDVHAPGESVTLLLNVPGKDASDGQWKAYNARLAELQTHVMGLPKPDPKANMKGIEGKRVGAAVSVYKNPTSGKEKQQVDRFVKAEA